MIPIIKWVGGKRQILPILNQNLPKNFNNYFEPFIGGGALLFNIQPKNAYISDINFNIINLYNVIKNNLNELIENLKYHEITEEYYYMIRNMDISNLNNIQLASRFLFLNKTCFNGLYRENSKGKFNVPFGKYKNPKLLDISNAIEISNYFNNNNININNFDYKNILEYVNKNDFIYFDPIRIFFVIVNLLRLINS